MSYIGAGASMLGGIMQSIAASQEQKAMFDAFNKEQGRQRGFSDQATATWMPSLFSMSAENAGKERAAGEAARLGAYSDIGNIPLSTTSTPYGLAGSDKARLGLEAVPRAAVGGLTDWQLDRAINNIRTNQELRKISDTAAGQANVFPYRMYQAQHSMDELAFWGQLIASLGGGASSYANSFGGSGPQTGYMQGNPGMGYNWGYQSPDATLLWNNSGFNPLPAQ